MSLPTPNYVTDEEYTVTVKGTNKILPVRSFARPISYYYLPEYLREEEEAKPVYGRMNQEKEVYCYTHFGLVLLPWKLLRKV